MLKTFAVTIALLLPSLTWAHEPEVQDPLLRVIELRQQARRVAFDEAQRRRDLQLEAIALRQARLTLLARKRVPPPLAAPFLPRPENGRNEETTATAGGAWRDSIRSRQ